MTDDYDNDFAADDFGSDDFDSTEPTESRVDRQDDTISAVADLILGDERALDRVEPGDGGFGRSGNAIRDTESTRDDRKADANWARQYDKNHQNYPQSPGDTARQALETQSQIHDQAAQLRERHAAGLVSDAEFQNQMGVLGYHNMSAQLDQLRAEKQAAEYSAHMTLSHNQLAQRHSEWADPVKRSELQRRATTYAMENFGLDPTIMAQIDDPRVADFVLTAYKQNMALKEAQLKNKKYASEARKRNQALGQGRRDAEVGARGKGTATQIDEVVKVLFGGGK